MTARWRRSYPDPGRRGEVDDVRLATSKDGGSGTGSNGFGANMNLVGDLE